MMFEEGGRTYCYLADNDDYCEGDLAVVPAGSDNHETIVRIESIEYHSGDEAPFLWIRRSVYSGNIRKMTMKMVEAMVIPCTRP